MVYTSREIGSLFLIVGDLIFQKSKNEFGHFSFTFSGLEVVGW
jgi:hypothetical protein